MRAVCRAPSPRGLRAEEGPASPFRFDTLAFARRWIRIVMSQPASGHGRVLLLVNERGSREVKPFHFGREFRGCFGLFRGCPVARHEGMETLVRHGFSGVFDGRGGRAFDGFESPPPPLVTARVFSALERFGLTLDYPGSCSGAANAA